MPGGFSANMAESAHDPLHARTMVLDDGATKLSMTVVDNLGAGPDVLDEAKAIASKVTGIPVEKMLVSSTHSHSAAPLNTRSEPAAAYRKLFVEGVADSIVQAHAALRPAAPTPACTMITRATAALTQELRLARSAKRVIEILPEVRNVLEAYGEAHQAVGDA